MLDKTLDKTYDPKSVESRIYEFWESEACFKPESQQGLASDAQSFCIVIPPPNVTGTLHMGHALDDTLQDILIRYNRMAGQRTLWMPGTDHAGIATQNVVERQLREQGKTKFDLGREAFVDEVWTWAKARQGDIWNQFKRLGISPDFDRARFTLDEGCSKAVREAFVTLYERDLIYRGTYIVNWCPRCTSAISDIETEYAEEDSFLWEISYPLKDQPGALVVATTRPETMFGDVAVAVNPEDGRYKNLIGKTLVLPLAGVEIPIIADDYVDASFGTGAVKITPAHDPNDCEIGIRHNLQPIWVLDESGLLKNDDRIPEELRGMDRVAARKRTAELLQQHGFLVKTVPHKHNVGHCQRCSTTIEPLLSKQWFVRSKPIAEGCIERYNKGELKFVPERWSKIYLDWMTNIRDWCISRQLWWGHQIPAWYCADCGEVTVSREDATSCCKCASTNLTQETDVLDTWFSSALWPFSTMGWPDQTAPDFKAFYPTSVLVTGFDIIFFWVARMTMFAHALTDQSPFHTVYIHGLVRDEKGQKMSKSKGNTIDPVEIIEEYGSDALRYSLTSLVTGGQDIKLSKDSFDKGRLFANKLWNASRFVLMNLEGSDAEPIDRKSLSTMDQWILGSLDKTIITINSQLQAYQFGPVADELYRFIWSDFCDWYVEYAKKQLREESTKANTQRILHHVLDSILKLLHPVMPHISEEIWQKLPHKQGKALILSDFPQPHPTFTVEGFAALEQQVNVVMETIRVIRETRQSSGVAHSQAVPVTLEVLEQGERETLVNNQDILTYFVKIDGLVITASAEASSESLAIGVSPYGRVLVSLAGTVDVEAEKARQLKKREGLQKEYDQLSGRLNNPGFVEKAPAAVVEKDRARLTELKQQIDAIDQQLAALKA